MIPDYTISWEPAIPRFMERVVERVASNPRAFVLDKSPKSKTVCFASTGEWAKESAERVKHGKPLSLTVASFRLRAEKITRTPESGDGESYAQLVEIIRWILQTFPGYCVTNNETGEDATQSVAADPDILFVSDWKRGL